MCRWLNRQGELFLVQHDGPEHRHRCQRPQGPAGRPFLRGSAVRLALLQGAVDFVQSLFDAQGREASGWVLVPALLHQLH